MPGILVDTGPLVALFESENERHRDTCKWLKAIGKRSKLCSALPCVTEALFLLGPNVDCQGALLDWVASGAVSLYEPSSAGLRRAAELMREYGDLPMDFADALLVAAAEDLKLENIATFDRGFLVYRIDSRRPFKPVFWITK